MEQLSCSVAAATALELSAAVVETFAPWAAWNVALSAEIRQRLRGGAQLLHMAAQRTHRGGDGRLKLPCVPFEGKLAFVLALLVRACTRLQGVPLNCVLPQNFGRTRYFAAWMYRSHPPPETRGLPSQRARVFPTGSKAEPKSSAR